MVEGSQRKMLCDLLLDWKEIFAQSFAVFMRRKGCEKIGRSVEKGRVGFLSKIEKTLNFS